MLAANPGHDGGALKFPVLHPLAKRKDSKDLSVRGVSRGDCTSGKRNKSHSDSALAVKDLAIAGRLKQRTTARHQSGKAAVIFDKKIVKTFAVPPGVSPIGQAQVVQRPSSPHASEIEPSVDEVI